MKLTKEMKERMSSLILTAKFEAEEKDLDKTYNEIGDAIYSAVSGIEKLTELPGAWFPSINQINCSFAGLRGYVPLSAYRPAPYFLYDKRQDFPFEHPFSVKFRAYHDALANLAERKREVKMEIKGVLQGVNTDKQLLAIWPEAIKWLPSTQVSIPVIQSVDRLKQLLGDDI